MLNSPLPDNPQVFPCMIAGGFGEYLTTLAATRVRNPLLKTIVSLVIPTIEVGAFVYSLHQKDSAMASQAVGALIGSCGGAIANGLRIYAQR